jgi:crossover junction endodeoxyribonuclease RuvC
VTVVAGLDLSLTATGMALIEFVPEPVPSVWTVESSGHRNDSLAQRAGRLLKLAVNVHESIDFESIDLIVVEGPAVMAKGGSNWDRAGLWWLVLDPLLEAGVLVAVAAPTVVKKWAAGKGTADKAAVAVGVSRLWPDVDGQNDNEWDALALATMGAQHLGLPVPSRAHHADALAKVEWPADITTPKEQK